MLDRLSRRINPSSIAEVNVGGEYWPVYLRTHPCNENHVCIGIVLKLKFPETKLLWKLEMPALVCSEAAREQWQFVVDLTEEALEDGDEASPAPNTIVYGRRLLFQGKNEQQVLNVLFKTICLPAHTTD